MLDADAEAQQAGRNVFLPSQFARRSMGLSTPPRLVALVTTPQRLADRVGTRAAPPRTSKDSMAPKPASAGSRAHARDRRPVPGTGRARQPDGPVTGRPVRRPIPGRGPAGRAVCEVPATPETPPAHRVSRRPDAGDGAAGRPTPRSPLRRPGQQIRVAADELGRAVQDEIRAERERPLASGVAKVLSTTTSAPAV